MIAEVKVIKGDAKHFLQLSYCAVFQDSDCLSASECEFISSVPWCASPVACWQQRRAGLFCSVIVWALACTERHSLIYLLLSGKYNYLFSFRAVSQLASTFFPLKWWTWYLEMEVIISYLSSYPYSVFSFPPSPSGAPDRLSPSDCGTARIWSVHHGWFSLPLTHSASQPVSRSVLPPHSGDKHRQEERFFLNCRSESSALVFHTARHFPALSNHSALQLPTSAGNQWHHRHIIAR